ncbi:MAG TPA: MoaD/ThiS family protein [Burkholderiaceae bacterium]|jgi:molybdopterin synthase sulfur carrier subunit|nr:MoaD/ThiS family protein [Burkholderiaceae bacterium]
MRLAIRYFASLRETLGAGESFDWQPAGAPTAASLRADLRARSPAARTALAPERAVRVAVDQVMAVDGTLLHEGAEVAFFPPVTGG